MQDTLNKRRQAAVIVLLNTANNTLVLTKRTRHLPLHAGEICFPGGGWQQGDSSLLDTGLRELEEELGVHKDRLNTIVSLSSEITLTGYCIQPWFATIADIHPYLLQNDEVEDILFVEFAQARNNHNYQPYFVPCAGRMIKTVQFKYQGHTIWGATARIMRQLCDTHLPL